MAQYSFGSGNLFGVRTDIANATPTQFGVVQLLMIMAGSSVLAGCAPQTYWYKDSVSQQQQMKDAYACEKDMRQSGYFGSGLAGQVAASGFFDRCMMASGYEKRESCTGLNPPPGCP